MIEIKCLSKKFSSKTVLNNISLKLDKGGVYGIVGENGAGKTTLFRCISGLEKYEGIISSEVEPLKNCMGFLTTEPFFFSKITGREYLQLLCNARGFAIGDADRKNIFDLPLDQYAETYSTGMKKKLALMGVLLQNNQFFVLDEPFNGVDIQSNLIIKDIILKLKESGKTVVISSHIFSTLRETCDKIFHLKNGEIVSETVREDFDRLEEEIRQVFIGNKIERLGIV
jgi:ABC-2 type transport system ATP-binding protein